MRIQNFLIKNRTWAFAIIFTLFGAIGITVYGTSYVSPFISNPQDILHGLNTWAVEGCFDEQQILLFFIFDALLAAGFALLLMSFYHFFVQKKTKKWVYLVLVLAFVFDLVENYYFYNLYYVDKENILNVSYITLLKNIFYGLSLVAVVSVGFKYFFNYINDNRRKSIIRIFFRQYFTYYYPSLISLVILLILFNLMSQFDALFIELTEPVNLLIFTFLMLSSLVKVWYMPYYLQETDAFYGKLKEKEYVEGDDENIFISSKNFRKVISWIGLFKPLRSVLKEEAEHEVRRHHNGKLPSDTRQLKQEIDRIIRSILAKVRPLKAEKEEVLGSYAQRRWKYKQENKNKLFGYEANNYFHLVRRFLGLLFILVLFNLQYDALKSMMRWSFPTGIATLIMFLLGVFTLIHVSNWTNTEERRKIIFKWFLVLAFSACVLLGLAAFFHEKVGLGEAMFTFLVSNIFAGTAYIFLTVFRYPKAKKILSSKLENKGIIGVARLDFWQNTISSMLLFLNTILVPILAVFALLYCFFCDLSYSHILNPVNAYLLFVNGIVSAFAVIDRAFKLGVLRGVYDLVKQKDTVDVFYDKYIESAFRKNYNSYFAIIATVGLILFFLFLNENYHHEVVYLSDDQKNVEQLPDLEEYTEKFLTRLPKQDSTIYLIAAEGGGLRAAYWTMLVLEALGEKAYQQTFLLSGASGGGIGQGIYNYLKASDIPKKDRKRIIETISQHNFLTTDMAGLFTRSALTTLIPSDITKGYGDRHYFMEKGYWDIIGNVKPAAGWHKAKLTPFYQLWQEKDYDLPLMIINTTRTEDGSRGIVHPLNKKETILKPYTDISHNVYGEGISYPDAVFLTNRFPVASPAARVEGKGHFVDGGYFENTGLKTVLHVIGKMQARKNKSEVFRRFFNDYEVKVISIRNSKEAFIDKEIKRLAKYDAENVNRTFKKGELGSVLGAIAGSGTTGLSNYYGSLLDEQEVREYLGISDFEVIPLPYLISLDDVHSKYFRGQLPSEQCSLKSDVNLINLRIKTFYKAKTKNEKVELLMPPLGRMMNANTTEYMRTMIEMKGVLPTK